MPAVSAVRAKATGFPLTWSPPSGSTTKGHAWPRNPEAARRPQPSLSSPNPALTQRRTASPRPTTRCRCALASCRVRHGSGELHARDGGGDPPQGPPQFRGGRALHQPTDDGLPDLVVLTGGAPAAPFAQQVPQVGRVGRQGVEVLLGQDLPVDHERRRSVETLGAD